MNVDIVFLIGPPGVGKSTWCEKMYQGERILISSDAIIEDIARSEGKTYNEVFQESIKYANKMAFSDFDAACVAQYPLIVIDRTNMTINSRNNFIRRIPKGTDTNYNLIAIVFDIPEEDEWKRRLDRPGKSIPNHVIESMIASYQPPSLEEGFREIRRV